MVDTEGFELTVEDIKVTLEQNVDLKVFDETKYTLEIKVSWLVMMLYAAWGHSFRSTILQCG